MIKYMPTSDRQRAKLIEADAIASKIALCETDEHTQRAAVMYCLHGAIEGFPPKLINNRRKLLDCIDIEDHDNEDIAYASLFLFDDILIIAKRHNPNVGCRALTGLDALERAGGALPPLTGVGAVRRNVMSYKGSVEITEVSATSIGPGTSALHLYFSTPPAFDAPSSDRWMRSFRSLHVVHPPRPPAFDPISTGKERTRFLDNLWDAQARIRERHGRSIVLGRPAEEMEERKGNRERVRVYWNVYERKAYLGEPRKVS
jgi:protein ECT2